MSDSLRTQVADCFSSSDDLTEVIAEMSRRFTLSDNETVELTELIEDTDWESEIETVAYDYLVERK